MVENNVAKKTVAKKTARKTARKAAPRVATPLGVASESPISATPARSIDGTSTPVEAADTIETTAPAAKAPAAKAPAKKVAKKTARKAPAKKTVAKKATTAKAAPATAKDENAPVDDDEENLAQDEQDFDGDDFVDGIEDEEDEDGVEALGEESEDDEEDGSSVWDEDESATLRQARKDAELTASADSVRAYLKQIGKVALLNAEQEVSLAKRIEAGLYATHRMEEMEEAFAAGDKDAKLTPAVKRDLRAIARDGRKAKNHLLEANLVWLSPWQSATPAVAWHSWTSSRKATSV